jgi:hypothetical protein
MGDWIKCSDQTPRDRQAVIISDGHDVGVWRWRGFWPNREGDSCSVEHSATILLGPITHWYRHALCRLYVTPCSYPQNP